MIIFPATLHTHFVHWLTIPLYTISVLAHAHSAALDNTFQSPVLAVFPTLACPMKLFAVGTTLLNVYVAVFELLFHNVSLTHPVLVCTHGCCAVIHVVVVAHHAVPLKLYAVHAVIPTHVSLAAVISKLHATHSFPAALLNVNVGAVLSKLYCSVSTKVVLQLFNASHEIAFNVVVALND